MKSRIFALFTALMLTLSCLLCACTAQNGQGQSSARSSSAQEPPQPASSAAPAASAGQPEGAASKPSGSSPIVSSPLTNTLAQYEQDTHNVLTAEVNGESLRFYLKSAAAEHDSKLDKDYIEAVFCNYATSKMGKTFHIKLNLLPDAQPGPLTDNDTAQCIKLYQYRNGKLFDGAFSYNDCELFDIYLDKSDGSAFAGSGNFIGHSSDGEQYEVSGIRFDFTVGESHPVTAQLQSSSVPAVAKAASDEEILVLYEQDTHNVLTAEVFGESLRFYLKSARVRHDGALNADYVEAKFANYKTSKAGITYHITLNIRADASVGALEENDAAQCIKMYEYHGGDLFDGSFSYSNCDVYELALDSSDGSAFTGRGNYVGRNADDTVFEARNIVFDFTVGESHPVTSAIESSSASFSTSSQNVGRLNVECPRCGGTGKCTECGGTGRFQTVNGGGKCPFCVDGVCSTCHGMGQI